MSELVALKVNYDRQSAKSEEVIKAHVIYSTGAGLIPLPVVDMAALLGIQISLVHKLGNIYGNEGSFQRKRVRRWIRILSTDLGVAGIFSGIKAIPLVGSLVGMFGTPLYSAAATYALGRVFLLHFAQGGTLLDFDPYTTRQFFRAEYDHAKQMQLEEGGVQSSIVKPPKEERGKSAIAMVATNQNAGSTDFSLIEGIGSKISDVLNKAGIASFQILARTSPEELTEILKAAGSRFNIANPDTWPQQADLIAKNKLDELKKYQESLKGGVEEKAKPNKAIKKS